MSEQMIRELALAIQRADDEKAPDSPLFPDDPEISDWGIHIARAAHSVMAGKVAELAWQPIETAPHAMHVLAARFDEAFGEWIYGVVLSPPSNPFTHWMPLPTPPAEGDS